MVRCPQKNTKEEKKKKKKHNGFITLHLYVKLDPHSQSCMSFMEFPFRSRPFQKQPSTPIEIVTGYDVWVPYNATQSCN